LEGPRRCTQSVCRQALVSSAIAQLNDFVDWLLKSPISLFRCAINFSRYSFGLGKGPFSQFKELTNVRAKALLGGSLPLGFLMYLRDRRALRSS
jgi:hypothetical protein